MDPRPWSRLLPSTLFLLAACGCSGLLPTPPEAPPSSFVLAPRLPDAGSGAGASGRGIALVVSRPEAGAGYGTQRMAYVEQDFRLDYFADHQWVDPPATMLAPLLVEALTGSSVFGSVSGDTRGIRAALRLDTVIEVFDQDFRTRPSRARIVLSARLVDPAEGRVLATRRFEDTQVAPTDTAYGGVQAINGILSRMLPEVADFAARESARHAQGAAGDSGPSSG